MNVRALALVMVCSISSGCSGLLDGVFPWDDNSSTPIIVESPDGPRGPDRPTEDPMQAGLETFEQRPFDETDVLFVVDSTCSMAPDLGTLASAFPVFLANLDPEVDVHIGVTSIDGSGAAGAPGELREVEGVTVITNTTADPEGIFARMVSQLPEAALGSEAGRDVVFSAIEQATNPGFYRANAALHVVVVSDGEDLSTEVTEAEFVEWFDGLKRNATERSFSSMVSADDQDYTALTQAIGGLIYSLDRQRMEDPLQALGFIAAGLQQEFFLSGFPDPQTLMVTVEEPDGRTLNFEPVEFDVDGNIANDDPSATFLYQADRNSITLLDFVPLASSLVHVEYEPLP